VSTQMVSTQMVSTQMVSTQMVSTQMVSTWRVKQVFFTFVCCLDCNTNGRYSTSLVSTLARKSG
jgi:hypothetical protein